MFHLGQAIYDQLTLVPEYSVLILGLDNAGKTTLFEKLKTTYIPNYQKAHPERTVPTVGVRISTVRVDGTQLVLWDLGGQHDLRSLWESYYEQAHAIVFVVDSCDLDRIVEFQTEFMNTVTNEKTEGLPILMLANKQDVEIDSKLDVASIKEIFNKMAENLNANDSTVLPISAFTGDGIGDAMTWLRNRILLNTSNRPPRYVKRGKRK